MKTSEILEAAAEYHAEHGSCKGTYMTDDGKVCLLGALHAVLGVTYTLDDEDDFIEKFPSVEANKQFQIACSVLRSELDENVPSFDGLAIHEYNDHEDVSGEDVTLLLRRSAERARGYTQ